ncbi:MAG TPA: hypothetical protein ENN29_07975 [Candidatus Hydrogenedentes bacterium]|nr:hypothetical protein [Candidatus Hydrogenedentota bacterium]
MSKKAHKTTLSRREFLSAASMTAAAAMGASFHIGKAAAQQKGRIIMLGFDGMEPSIVEDMLERGSLPRFAALRQQGGAHRLTTTIPPQSPVAWNSFATCQNPGAHNIFDFIRRNPGGAAGPFPLVGTGRVNPPTLAPTGALIAPATADNYRKGTAFWSAADEQGLRAKVLNIPFCFPPDPLKHGLMLSGLGAPDLRGTTSTYFALSDSFTKAQLGEDLGGGRRVALAFDGADEATLNVPGPRDARHRFGAPGAYAETPLRIKVNRADHRGTVEADGGRVEIEQGVWSDWLELRFAMSDAVEIMGITRFFPQEIGEQTRIYMACVQYHPDAPYTPLTAPNEYSAELKGRYGLYKTVGWTYDTHAVRQNDMTEDAFLKDIENTMAWRERLTLDELERGQFDMLLSAWTATDRVGHLFWRFRDAKHPYYDPDAPEHWRNALERVYQRADEITGNVMKQLRDNDALFVFSDHGFGSWRTGFNLNTWLRDNGYLKIANPHQADRGFLQGIDWNETRAYSVGLSSLYLNVRGRESGGIVAPGAAESLAAEIADRLKQVKDPASGAQVFSNLYLRNVYHGEAMADAPDISLGYAPYYQNARQTSRGGAGAPLFESVEDKWSGEHASTDYQHAEGMFFANIPVEKKKPHIQDLGVTALKRLGADMPAEYEGDAI